MHFNLYFLFALHTGCLCAPSKSPLERDASMLLRLPVSKIMPFASEFQIKIVTLMCYLNQVTFFSNGVM